MAKILTVSGSQYPPGGIKTLRLSIKSEFCSFLLLNLLMIHPGATPRCQSYHLLHYQYCPSCVLRRSLNSLLSPSDDFIEHVRLHAEHRGELITVIYLPFLHDCLKIVMSKMILFRLSVQNISSLFKCTMRTLGRVFTTVFLVISTFYWQVWFLVWWDAQVLLKSFWDL